MEKTMKIQPTAEEAAYMEAEITRMFAEMDRADERIKRDQEEIDRLKVETQAILAQLRKR